ncbi:MAG: hypothetical protein Q8K36_07455, partial [Alphaproteobacteria bacterium]|nr:hypothetical protein [Alphaproteobacteria bacterium]
MNVWIVIFILSFINSITFAATEATETPTLAHTPLSLTTAATAKQAQHSQAMLDHTIQQVCQILKARLEFNKQWYCFLLTGKFDPKSTEETAVSEIKDRVMEFVVLFDNLKPCSEKFKAAKLLFDQMQAADLNAIYEDKTQVTKRYVEEYKFMLTALEKFQEYRHPFPFLENFLVAIDVLKLFNNERSDNVKILESYWYTRISNMLKSHLSDSTYLLTLGLCLLRKNEQVSLCNPYNDSVFHGIPINIAYLDKSCTLTPDQKRVFDECKQKYNVVGVDIKASSSLLTQRIEMGETLIGRNRIGDYLSYVNSFSLLREMMNSTVELFKIKLTLENLRRNLECA